MGGPRLVSVGARPEARKHLGDVLHELAQTDPQAMKAFEALARWRLVMAHEPLPPLRAKDLFKPAKAGLRRSTKQRAR